MSNDEPLKAVILAHDYAALSLSSLLPSSSPPALSTTPFFSWTFLELQLEALSHSAVAEVVVLCGDGADVEVERDLEKGAVKETKGDGKGAFYRFRSLRIYIARGSNWMSSGDALRELESLDFFRPRQDFILIEAGALFNLNLDGLLAEHKKRRSKDKSWILSAVFMPSGRGAAMAMAEGRGGSAGKVVAAIDPETTQMVLFKHVTREAANLNVDLLTVYSNKSRKAIRILSDIRDGGVYICSPDILIEFRENFDFGSISDLLQEKLGSGDAELLGNKFATKLVGTPDSGSSEYCLRINSLSSYVRASQDFLQRWLYPLTLDAPVFSRAPSSFAGGSYVDSGADVPDGARRRAGVVVLDGAKVGEGAELDGTIVGKGVAVGKRSSVMNSILMDGAVVEDDCIVTNAVLFPGSRVKSRATIGDGCVIGADCIIGADFQLSKGSWISMSKPDEDESSDDDSSDDAGFSQADVSSYFSEFMMRTN